MQKQHALQLSHENSGIVLNCGRHPTNCSRRAGSEVSKPFPCKFHIANLSWHGQTCWVGCRSRSCFITCLHYVMMMRGFVEGVARLHSIGCRGQHGPMYWSLHWIAL